MRAVTLASFDGIDALGISDWPDPVPGPGEELVEIRAVALGPWDIAATEGSFAVAGAGLYVGRHAGDPLTDDYPGKPPYRFTGGKIHRVAVDLSGEAYTDLEHHAAMLLKHQ